MSKKGKLYLVPVPLGENAGHTIPPYVVDVLHRLDYFIAERAKTARAYIKTTGPKKAFSELHFFEINKRTDQAEIPSFLDPALEGHDIGLLSEAGCPGVADPGAQIVALAHQRDIEVVPMVGPSSILLALMGSGLNGQNFVFHGYLSPKKPELVKDLKDLILAKQDFPEEVILDLSELEGIGVMGIQIILAVRENLMKNKSGLKLKMKEEMEPILTWTGLNWLKEESSA